MNTYNPNKNSKETRGFFFKNFRVFNEKEEFSFAPLTLLVGPNSSGKSSLISLASMLVKSAQEHKDLSFVPRSIDGKIYAGAKIDVCSSLPSSEDPLLIGFESTSIKSFKEIAYTLSYVKDVEKSRLVINRFSILRSGKEIFVYNTTEESETIQFDLKGLLECYKSFLDFRVNDPFRYSDEKKLAGLNSDLFILEESSQIYLDLLNHEFEELLNFEQKNNSLIFLDLKNLEIQAEMMVLPRNFYNSYDNGLYGLFNLIYLKVEKHLKFQLKKKIGIEIELDKTEFGLYFGNKFSVELEKEFYLSIFSQFKYEPFRVFKTKRGRFFELDENINSTFDNVLNNYIKSNLSRINKREIPSNNIVNEWLVRFGIGRSLKITSLDESNSLFSVKIVGFDMELIDLASLGFGAGNIISMILLPFLYVHHSEFVNKTEEEVLNDNYIEISFDIFKDTVIYLEEPESNLHPDWQSKMAELFAYHLTLGMRYVVETHSEYFIRKLQYEIARSNKNEPSESTFSIKSDQVTIYYLNSNKNVNKENGESKVKMIKIDEKGALSDNFGPGFYDESINLKFDLLKLNNYQSN